jgi:hypothetical protein
MTSVLARRVEKLTAAQRSADHQRWQAGIDRLLDSMSTEHRESFWAWMDEHCAGRRIPALPGERPVETILRLQPPALVRAVWILMLEYQTGGATPVIPPDVADVYLSDPDAYPANYCEGCRYLMPARSKLRADGSYRHLALYEGECPACGRDNHQEDEEGTP